MAEITKDIDTGGLGDYASLNVWESTEEQDLTDGGGDWMHATNRASGDAADTISTTINGWTTGIANYILIDAAVGDEAVKTGFVATRARLEVTDARCFYNLEDFVRWDGLQLAIRYSAVANEYMMLHAGVGAGDLRISNCYIDIDTLQRGIRFNDADIVASVWNTIITGGYLSIIVSNCNTVDILNSVLYGSGAGGGVTKSAGTVTVKNSAVFKTGDDFIGSPDVISSCASDDDDTTDATNVAESGGGADWPDDFEEAGAGNFTLKATSNLKWAGTPDPGSGLFSTDMEGDAYEDPPSLGVDEIVAAPGGVAPTGTLSGPLGGPLVGVF